MNSNVSIGKYKGINLPNSLVVGNCSISCIYLIDVGEIHISEALQAIAHSNLYRDIARHKFDANFFNPVFSMTPLSFVPLDNYIIESIELPVELSDYYQKRAHKIKMLQGGDFVEKFFLYPNGILVYQIIISVDRDSTTDDIICITNILAKLNPTIFLRSTSVHDEIVNFQIFNRLKAAQHLIETSCHSKSRVKEVDTYSLIFIQRLSEEIEHILDSSPDLRSKIYDVYENEFHAMCVRTIEDWEKRYPKNTKFNEPNASLSPVGILRINYRNTLAYEYPYSKEIVSKLYYPAIIELRAWNLLLSIFLSEVQTYIDQISDLPFNSMPISDIEIKRKLILNALDDFNGYAMSTSRRTSNLYNVAINLFQIKDVTNLLLEKLASLQVIVSQQFNNINTEKQNENSIIQNKLLITIQEVLKSQHASSLPILLINILIGGQIAFAASSAYNLNPTIVLTIYLCLIPFFILLIKAFENSQFIERQFLEADVIIEGTFNITLLDALLQNYKNALFVDIAEVNIFEDGMLLQLKQSEILNRITFINLGIKTNRLLQLGNDEKGTVITLTFSSNYNYIKYTNAKEKIAEYLYNIFINLSHNQQETNLDRKFFKSADDQPNTYFSKRYIKNINIKNFKLKI